MWLCVLCRRRVLQLHYDLEISQQGGSTAVNELRAQRRLWQQRLNWEIQSISLELIVNIFRSAAGDGHKGVTCGGSLAQGVVQFKLKL